MVTMIMRTAVEHVSSTLWVRMMRVAVAAAATVVVTMIMFFTIAESLGTPEGMFILETTDEYFLQRLPRECAPTLVQFYVTCAERVTGQQCRITKIAPKRKKFKQGCCSKKNKLSSEIVVVRRRVMSCLVQRSNQINRSRSFAE